jgi:hypothetical protein
MRASSLSSSRETNGCNARSTNVLVLKHIRMTFMLRLVVAVSLFMGCLTGCSNVDDPDRVPEGAVDTSNPSMTKMEGGPPGAPSGAQPGPPGGATAPAPDGSGS